MSVKNCNFFTPHLYSMLPFKGAPMNCAQIYTCGKTRVVDSEKKLILSRFHIKHAYDQMDLLQQRHSLH